MVLPEQPKSMIVCGSGAIGSEFAYFYNSMGTKVTIVEFMPRIVPVEDEDISKELEKQFKKQGINILTNSEVLKVDTSGSGVKATIKTATGEQVLEADILLSAVGVVANIEGIGLEELGVKLDKGKIIVDANQQTNIPGLYAIGHNQSHWVYPVQHGTAAPWFQCSSWPGVRRIYESIHAPDTSNTFVHR